MVTSMELATRIAGRYRVDARLGGGGMADVFDAYDEQLHRPVAVKLLRGIDEAGAARRFAEEIRLTARVNHPNIVALYDAGEHDGSPFLVLERVNGGTLAGEMAAGPMDPRRVAAIGEQLASALSHSHAAGIVHRDVKPTNVLIAADGSVRLADFGIAVTATATRLTVTGTVAGSAGYVSPEQVLGSGAGAPSDIYALGLVLLECLTGAPPWSGTTVEVALARITTDPPMPADLPEEWATLLRAMTSRQPEDRPSIDLVGHALSKLAQGEEYETAFFAPPAPPSDRRVPAVAGMSMIVLLLSAMLVLSSGVTPQAAIADAGPVVSLSAADNVLSKAVTPVAAAPAAPKAEPQTKAEKPRKKKARTRAAKQRRNASQTDVAQAEVSSSSSQTTPSRTTATATRSASSSTTRSGSGSGSKSGSGDSDKLTDLTTTTTTTKTTNVSTPTVDTTTTKTTTTKLTGKAKARAKRAAAAAAKLDDADFKINGFAKK